MRGYFAYELYQAMKKDESIWLVVGDLGYKVFDHHFKDFPNRCINVGAAEQAMMGIAVGLALEGKKPFVYSITSFLLYRPFETIRNYVDHEKIAVRLVGSGRDKDYAHDGFSHWMEEAKDLFYKQDFGARVPGIFGNIHSFWPDTKEEIPEIVKEMVKRDIPQFISLRR